MKLFTKFTSGRTEYTILIAYYSMKPKYIYITQCNKTKQWKLPALCYDGVKPLPIESESGQIFEICNEEKR